MRNTGILGVDYGEERVGLAYSSEQFIANPYATVSRNKSLSAIKSFCETHNVGMIIVGLPSGRIAPKVRVFVEKLRKIIGIAVETYDETLSSKRAAEKLVEMGLSRKRRRKLEDATAAAILLQSFIDEKNKQ